MTEELIQQVARAIFACHFADTPDAQSMMAKSWGRPSPLSDMVHREALAAIAAMQPHIAARCDDAAGRALEAAAKSCDVWENKYREAYKSAKALKKQQDARDFEIMSMAFAFRAFGIRAIDPAQFREAGNG